MPELDLLAERLDKATSYTDIFTDADTVKDEYRLLVRLLHPDNHVEADKPRAEAAFHKLSVFKAEALQMAQEGRWGEQRVIATIRSKRAVHEVMRKLGSDEMAAFFRAVTKTDDETQATVLKVALKAKDNNLFAQEAKALKKLHSEVHMLSRHFPYLVDTFLHSEGRRRANVTPAYDGFYTLAEIRKAFPTGLDPIHGAWMFRRLLMALGYAHDQGLVHCAVLPGHVLIGAPDHAVVLIDWCYSQVIDAESKTNSIKVVPMYKHLYAPEIIKGETPSAATDLYMAANLMLWLMPVAPKPFRAFFKGCTLTKQRMRPQSAWLLLEEFDQLLKEIGEPFYPKRWVEFAVPVGTA